MTRYKKDGVVKITDDLEMKDFMWWIAGVYYNWELDQPEIHIKMQIDGGEVTPERSFPFSDPSEWTSQNVIDVVFSMPQFANSTIIS